jgi:hypothetical protein
MAHFYRAGNAIEIEKAAAGLIEIKPAGLEPDCGRPPKR